MHSAMAARGLWGGGVPTPKVGVLTFYFTNYFAENCMKMKEFGSQGGGGVPGAPLDPPMQCDRCSGSVIVVELV